MSLNDAKIRPLKPSVKPSTLCASHDSPYPEQVIPSIVMVNILRITFSPRIIN